MIGELPTTLKIGGEDYSIRSDFRVMLNIFQAFNDPDLTEEEKCFVCLKCLYEDFEKITEDCLEEAVKKAYWFCDGGDIPKEENVKNVKTFDWEQDEHMIFPAVNKAAGYETRAVPYLHWWAFLGLFGEIGEGLFSQVVNIRNKRAKGKKLDKTEKEFYREHKNMIEIKKRLSEEELRREREDEEFIRELTGE